MEQENIFLALRTAKGLSQEELAEKVFVTRQAVSRWEREETLPGAETLKQLSRLYDVSIITLLGLPRHLVCQCCGMPLEDAVLSREPDGTLNEEYCKWCYTGGQFTYKRRRGRGSRCAPIWSSCCLLCVTGRKTTDKVHSELPVEGRISLMIEMRADRAL